MQVLVTGATGYIGGRLVPRLLEAGHAVRVFVRNPRKLQDVPWSGDVDVAEGDLQDAEAVRAAVDGVEAVYYLAHAMGADGDFEAAEREAAETMAHEAKAAGVSRFVYLGGLHPDGELSKHLRSRKEVGDILLGSGVPTVAYQAGVVIGSGSTSFEMIRHLTDVLPWMPAPRWVRNRIQPIAVRDVLYYLVAALDVPADTNRTFDIGGPDVLRYGQMLNGYAVEAKLPQRPITVLPVLTPRLAAHWFNAVTPIPRKLATPIIESLQFECVQREHDIDDVVPQPEGGLTSYRGAVRLALNKMRSGQVETSWRSATLSSASADPMPSDPDWAGHTVYVDDRKRHSNASAADVWRVVESIGGENGWYSFPLAWVARGWMDKVAGGVGLSRGRRDQQRLEQGDALDWWRVERLERGHYLRLRAEFKSPGRAWLEMTVTPTPDGGSDYHQRAIYFPQGLAGRLYWYGILPFHGIIFPGMVERITAAAERESDNTESTQRNRTQHNGTPEPAHEEAA
ncbi:MULTISPECIES: SDR family oxidoreductase [unclassified Curtobacterium]|uniref:SDR family oxidoreductase n=1 Tax=unclassified Curtobacterium TaxID=257496 RepID=UPI0008DDDE00|nr:MULTISPECIES: SDR family oxidoreductase [unclassified Curtobacterium]OIH98619.1 NAD(P)-dependent oxidoreductase [Curtobacterium sp. MCBA15_003]OII14973.1 NAD(P)-dependent oxidoreductase [Curtobacterium sp. MCBA15_009]OII32344.1 NAD(P)-dependent oxidoreductase [Curtobacterium sp. MMLR14_006]